jgi:hypothetical protein
VPSPFAGVPTDMVTTSSAGSTPPPSSGAGSTTRSAQAAAVEIARDGGYDEVPEASTTHRPSGHSLPDPPGSDGCLTPEGRQAAWARILGRQSYTLRDVEDRLASHRGAGIRDDVARRMAEKERKDNLLLGAWPDGVVRTGAVERQRRIQAELAWGKELADPATAMSYGVAGVFTDDENTRRSLGRMGGAGARIVGSLMAPLVRGTEPRPAEPPGPTPEPVPAAGAGAMTRHVYEASPKHHPGVKRDRVARAPRNGQDAP